MKDTQPLPPLRDKSKEKSMNFAKQLAEAALPTQLDRSIVIVGGGAAGITVAAQLKRRDPRLDIAIVEPSEAHSYQPGWTLVGAGIFTRAQTERREVHENVIAQLANLRTHPSVALALTQHRLTLHGWVYDIATGQVEALNGTTGRFVSLAEHPGVNACWSAPDDRAAIARCG